MIILRTTEEQIQDYFRNPALNQSLIKIANKGAKAFLQAKNKMIDEKDDALYFEEDSDSFIVGKGVDCIITQGQEAFEAQYFIAEDLESKPSDKIMSIVKTIFDAVLAEGTPFTAFEEQEAKILEAAETHSYYPRWGSAAKIKKICAEGKAYWQLLIDSKGLPILSFTEAEKIRKTAADILSSYVFQNALSKADVVIYQLPLYAKYGTYETKALLDMVTINFEYEKITIYDFKTMMGKVYDFPKSVRRFRYDIQMAWYHKNLKYILNGSGGLYSYLDNLFDLDVPLDENTTIRQAFVKSKDLELEQGLPTFIVASTTNDSLVVKFSMTKEFLSEATKGVSEHFYDGYSPSAETISLYSIPERLGLNQFLDLAVSYLQTESYENGIPTDKLEKGSTLRLCWDRFDIE